MPAPRCETIICSIQRVCHKAKERIDQPSAFLLSAGSHGGAIICIVFIVHTHARLVIDTATCWRVISDGCLGGALAHKVLQEENAIVGDSLGKFNKVVGDVRSEPDCWVPNADKTVFY